MRYFGIDEACIWYKLPDMTNPIDTIAGFWINPTSTATYVVRQQLWCTNTPKWDTVLVIADATVGFSQVSLSVVEDDLHVFPNPAEDFLELTLRHGSGQEIKNEEFKISLKTLSIFDHLGQLIRREEITNRIETKNLQEGVYFLELSGTHGTVRKRFVVAR